MILKELHFQFGSETDLKFSQEKKVPYSIDVIPDGIVIVVINSQFENASKSLSVFF